MKFENIRRNFSTSSEQEKREFFADYWERRRQDFEKTKLITVKEKKTSVAKAKKEPKAKLKLTPEQASLLKALNLI